MNVQENVNDVLGDISYGHDRTRYLAGLTANQFNHKHDKGTKFILQNII